MQTTKNIKMNKKLNDQVFTEYTQESCYWAGFLAADGCIDINNTVRIELAGKDVEHVQKFKAFCGSEHSISHNELKNSYKIGFSSPAIATDLYYKYAVTVDKTHGLLLPLLPELEFYRHYIRGFFDGDGCITEFFNNRPTATYRVFLTSGSIVFLEELLELLKNNSITIGGSIQKKAANCWHIQFGVKDSASFLTWIYSGATVYLPRKYDKYVNLVVNNNRAKRDSR